MESVNATVWVLIVGAIIFGYLIALVQQSRKASSLNAQLEQAQQALAQTATQNQESQSEIKRLNSALHEKDVADGKVLTQLENLQATEKRLMDELAERKSELNLANRKLETAMEQGSDAAKKLEAANTEIRGCIANIEDLSGRLEKREEELRQERAGVSKLKEDLAEEGKKAKELQASNFEAREQLKEVKSDLVAKLGSFTELQERYQSLSNEYTELKTTLQRKEEHFKEQMQQLSETKQSLTKEFENLANKIFEEKGKTFTHTSQTSIDTMLKPFREQIEGFQKRINEVHDASLQGNTSLNAEIRKVLDIGLQMSKEANNLTSALKGDSQQRGAWGEAQLRRTLEMSGLIEEAHYEVQSSFKDADGKQKQTDYLIKLPDGKHIIIDSKVALNAYDRAVGAESPEEYQLAMSEHVKAVRKHIDDLASKDYTNLVGMRSPSFVLMFMPIEPPILKH